MKDIIKMIDVFFNGRPAESASVELHTEYPTEGCYAVGVRCTNCKIYGRMFVEKGKPVPKSPMVRCKNCGCETGVLIE